MVITALVAIISVDGNLRRFLILVHKAMLEFMWA